MSAIKTIKVMPWGAGQGDFVEINESDFDEKKHQPFVEGKTTTQATDTKKKKAQRRGL